MTDLENMTDTVDVARFTQRQDAEIKRLQQALEESCAAGDRDQAKRTEERIVAIIKEGPPFHQWGGRPLGFPATISDPIDQPYQHAPAD